MTIDLQNVVVVGGTSGIGGAFVTALLDRYPDVTVTATHHQTEPLFEHERLQWEMLDVCDAVALENLSHSFDRVDWVFNSVGFLHENGKGPEKSIQAIDPEFFLSNVRINALPTLLLAKYFSKALKKSPLPILTTVSARVGSIEDNRLGGWYSYRASKAALNMALKTLSVEWKRTHPAGCVAALHPGTNKTRLSEPFQANVPPQNLFDPAYTASSFLNLLEQLDASQSGKFWAWDGANIPW